MEPDNTKQKGTVINMSIKILSIGNSFSADSFQWLPDILKSAGEKSATVAYLYIGGCSIERHYNNISEPTTDYTYFKHTGESWEATPESTLLHGIKDEPWDIILFQQASHFSGKPITYSHLNELIAFVDENKTNPDVRYGFNMTWAYQANSSHANFRDYGSNQIIMYRAICATVKAVICPNSSIYKVFPTGTVIQNLRQGCIGDRLTRDGFHLSLHEGRYAAALNIAYHLGYPIDNITFIPEEAYFTEKYITEMKTAIKNAAIVPFEITGI